MREFYLNSEDLLDQDAARSLRASEDIGLLPIRWIRYNSKIKLYCFTEGCSCLGERLPEMSLDEICQIGKKILDRVIRLEAERRVSLENISWDTDNIYLDKRGEVFLVCVPTILPLESQNQLIYVRRVYALLEEMVEHAEGGRELCRQIEFQMDQDFGVWPGLKDALSRRAIDDDESITLKSINLPEPFIFRIGHEIFHIGSDPDQAEGLLLTGRGISPVHAVIAWNEISFTVMDMDSDGGTFLNGQIITPMQPVPFGKGSVLTFGDYTFNVE